MNSKKISDYDLDFYQWTVAQAKLLDQKKFEEVDIPNLVEEIQSLGRADRRELKSHLVDLLSHLIKMEYQPDGPTLDEENSHSC